MNTVHEWSLGDSDVEMSITDRTMTLLLAAYIVITMPIAMWGFVFIPLIALVMMASSLRKSAAMKRLSELRTQIGVVAVLTYAILSVNANQSAAAFCAAAWGALVMIGLRHERGATRMIAPMVLLCTSALLQSESLGAVMACAIALMLVLMASSRGADISMHKSMRSHASYLVITLLWSAPVVVALFTLFPRMPTVFNEGKAKSATTGMSESMSPGSIAELVRNNKLAFEAQYQGKPLNRSSMYWRTVVLEQFDGRTWRIALAPQSAPNDPMSIKDRPAPIKTYRYQLPPSRSSYIPILEGTSAQSVRLTPAFGSTEFTLRPDPRGMFKTPYGPPTEEDGAMMTIAATYNNDPSLSLLPQSPINLEIPTKKNPQTIAFGQRLNEDHSGDVRAMVRAVNTMINTQSYHYTLKPPPVGVNAVDDFLFRTRAGFCEHYAGAFVMLMRAAGVPARVVTGYQGGQVDTVQRVIRVFSRDAHAWAEVWIKDEGWVRMDPTTHIDPSRIDAETAQQTEETSWMTMGWALKLQTIVLRMNSTWESSVVRFNEQSQQQLLERMGIPGHQRIAFFTILTAGTILMIIAVATAIHRSPKKPKPTGLQLFEQKFDQWLSRKGLNGGISLQTSPEEFDRLTKTLGWSSEIHASINRLRERHMVMRFSSKQHNEKMEIGQMNEELKRLERILEAH